MSKRWKLHLWFRVLFCLVLVLTLVGCIEKEDPDQLLKPQGEGQRETSDEASVDVRSYFPMMEGMVYNYAGEGNEFASFQREVIYVQDPYMQVLDTNGGTVVAKVYRVLEDKVELMYQQEEFYQDTNIIDQLGEDKSPKEIILKGPIQVGTIWTSGGRKRKIVGVNETLEVPVGIYHRVLVVRIASTDESNKSVTTEYFAENVGLIKREFKSGEVLITSKLAVYGILPEEPGQTVSEVEEERIEDLTLEEPDLALLAYQLERQMRAQYQAAYESYINLERVVKDDQIKFDQIIALYREGIQPIAVENQVKEQVNRLEDFYQAGEGEATFPTHEVVENVKVLKKNDNRAQVALTLTKYFLEEERSARAYDRTFNYLIDLVKEGNQWKIEKISNES